MLPPLTLAITGGSGSGKSTLSSQIRTHFGEQNVAVVEQDWYYRDLSGSAPEIAEQTNFDHPDSIELEFLEQQLRDLRSGQAIAAPQYNFSCFSRRSDTRTIEPRSIVIVDGFLAMHCPAIRKMIDLSVFIDVPSDIRLLRRIRRDISERGYKLDQILTLWETRAHPMHSLFVEPQKAISTHVWKSLKDKAFVTQFLADLESRLARNGHEPTTG